MSQDQERFASVWDAIEDTAEAAETMKVRSALMQALTDHIATAGLDQHGATRAFGVTPPRLVDLQQGHIDAFSLEALVAMAVRAGLHVEVRVSPTEHAA